MASNQWNAPMIDIELDEDDRIVFHSTSAKFDEFDEAKLGTGVDNNSALGFFFSDDVANIPYYMRDGRELVVAAVRVANPVTDWSYYDIFGFDSDHTQVVAKSDFARKRRDLIAAGFDAIEHADNEETMLIALQTSSIRILTRLNEPDANLLSQLISSLPDSEDDRARLECLRQVVAGVDTPKP